MSNVEAQHLLKRGITAVKSGELEMARRTFMKVTEINDQYVLGWIWLAGVTEAPDKVANYLQKALTIEPTNRHALEGLKWAMHELQRNPPMQWKCPICRVDLSKKMSQCTVCGAFLSLQYPDRLFSNDQLDEDRITRAIRHFEGSGALGHADNFARHFYLGLAYLNMRQIPKGVNLLKSAVSMHPDDQKLKSQFAELMNQPEVVAALTWQAEPPKQNYRGSVLIVDDSPTVRKLVTLTLERHDFRVYPANDGFEALSVLGKETPDLILLDITMPKMDGYQVCKIIRENQSTKNIPILMLSSKDGFFDKVRGRMAGSTDYLTKPFQPDTLLTSIQRYLDR
ncbi:MAG: response regulator [Chloroflexota bacterium]